MIFNDPSAATASGMVCPMIIARGDLRRRHGHLHAGADDLIDHALEVVDEGVDVFDCGEKRSEEHLVSHNNR
jgi:hypothetical protein